MQVCDRTNDVHHVVLHFAIHVAVSNMNLTPEWVSDLVASVS